MTYNVFGGTLSLTQSVNQSVSHCTDYPLAQYSMYLYYSFAINNFWISTGELDGTHWVTVLHVSKEYHQWCDLLWRRLHEARGPLSDAVDFTQFTLLIEVYADVGLVQFSTQTVFLYRCNSGMEYLLVAH